MTSIKRKNHQLRSIALILISLSWSFSVLFVPKPTYACSWLTQITCEIFNVSFSNIMDQVYGILLGALKNAAIQVVSQNVMIQIGGQGGGGPLFITNWRDTIYVQPAQQAQVALNDFFTLSTRGQSYTSYNPSQSSKDSSGWKIIPGETRKVAGTSTEKDSSSDPAVLAAATETSDINWLSGEGVLDSDLADVRSNYAEYLKEGAKKSLAGNDCTINVQEYGPVAGSFKSNDALMQNCNNIWQYSSSAQRAYSTAFTMESVLAQTKSVAYNGYNPVIKNGQVVTPGINISTLIDNVTALPGQIMAGVKNFPEFAAAAATSFINSAVNNLTQQGVAYVNGMVQTKTGGYVSVGLSSGGSYSNRGGYSSTPSSVNTNRIPTSSRSNQWQIIPGGTRKTY